MSEPPDSPAVPLPEPEVKQETPPSAEPEVKEETPPSPEPEVKETPPAEPEVTEVPPSSPIVTQPAEEAASPPPETPAAPPDPQPDPPQPLSRLKSILESLLFAADHPMTTVDLAALVDEPNVDVIEGALTLLGAEWSPRGIQLHPVAGGWQFRTSPQNATWVQKLVAQKPVRLTRPQLETLAICSYRQPSTRPEIDEIRGVDSGGTLKTLLDRALIRILGKKEEAGRPLLYGTTKEFLEFFNLRDFKELPTLREFQELSDEHRAQVEALERAAPPGTVEPTEAQKSETLPPLARVELSNAPLEEDMSGIDALINEAGERARVATEALGGLTAESDTPEKEPDRPPPES